MSTFDKSQGLTKLKRYGILRTSLETERNSFKPHWIDLAQFVQPRRTRFLVTDRNKGDKRNQKIIDSTASLALRTLRSGMHAGMTAPSRPWMKYSVADPDLAKWGPVKEWLHSESQATRDDMQRSNIYTTLPMMYGDAGLFASAAISVMEDADSVFRTYSYPIGSFAMAMNSRGKVDTFFREYEMTVFQVVEEFGVIPGTNTIDWSNLSTMVKTAWDKSDYQAAVKVVWVVMPNVDYDTRKLTSRYHKFASCWYEDASQEGKFLRESGFNEFPIIAPRWDVTGEDTYGTDSPGMSTLGAVKGLQTGKRLGGQALEKMVNPALQAPIELRQQVISMLPGNISYVADGAGKQGIRPLHDVNVALDKLELWNAQDRDQINNGFLVNFFLSMLNSDRREMTATEVEQRAQERSLILGPTFERFNDEAFDPMMDRIYAIRERRGLVSPPPKELHGMNLKVEYTSIMAVAQRLSGVVGLDRLLTTVVNASGVFPEGRHYIDMGAVITEYGDILDVNPKVIVPAEDAAKSIAAEQQAQMQQHQADVAAKYAGSARDLGNTPTTDNTALAQIVQGLRGAA